MAGYSVTIGQHIRNRTYTNLESNNHTPPIVRDLVKRTNDEALGRDTAIMQEGQPSGRRHCRVTRLRVHQPHKAAQTKSEMEGLHGGDWDSGVGLYALLGSRVFFSGRTQFVTVCKSPVDVEPHVCVCEEDVLLSGEMRRDVAMHVRVHILALHACAVRAT